MGRRSHHRWLWWAYGSVIGAVWVASIYLIAGYWLEPTIPDPLLRAIETLTPAKFHALVSSWLSFAMTTLFGVAVPILGLMFALYLTITLLLWAEGDPYVTTVRLAELISLGLAGAFYIGACVGLLIAFFGWPVLEIAEQLGLSVDMKEWLTFLLSPNYISLAAVSMVTLIAIAALLLEAESGSKSLRLWIADKLDIWWADPTAAGYRWRTDRKDQEER